MQEWIGFMKEMKYTKLTKVILTLIEICCFLLTIILTERNSMHVKTIFLCLFLGIVILFSDQSYTNKVHGKICGFFGRREGKSLIYHIEYRRK